MRYDKRAVGASAAAVKSESDLRFDTYVEDAAGWIAMLRDDARFSSVTVAGHSEGPLVGMLALQNASANGFASLDGAGRPAPAVLREQLSAQLPANLYAQADAAITQLQEGRLVTDAPPELAALLRPSVQPYLISSLCAPNAMQRNRVLADMWLTSRIIEVGQCRASPRKHQLCPPPDL